MQFGKADNDASRVVSQMHSKLFRLVPNPS